MDICEGHATRLGGIRSEGNSLVGGEGAAGRLEGGLR